MSESVKLWDMIGLYIKQRSINTQKSYIRTLEFFCATLQISMGTAAGARKFLAVTPFDIEKFIHAIKNLPGVPPREEIGVKRARQNVYKASLSTVSLKIFAMKSIYKELVEDEYLSKNPFRHVRPPSKDEERRQITYAVPIDRVHDLFKSCESDSRSGGLNQAILALFFGGGMRVGELAKIRVCDVLKTAGDVICVRLRQTKNGTDVDQPLADWAGKIIEEWKTFRIAEEGAYVTDPLLATTYRTTKSNINTRTIARRFKQLCEEAGLDSRFYCSHSARHTVITKLFLDGIPSIMVKNFARHRNLNTTQRYFSLLEQNAGAAKSLDFFGIKVK